MKIFFTPRANLLAALLFAIISVYAGDAPTVLMFDELPPESSPGNGWARIPNGYGGLQWNNFGVIDGSVQQVISPYRIGMVSPRNVAFNLTGYPASLNSGTGFTLHSAYLTTGHAGMHVRVQGLVGTTVTYDNTYTISNTAPALIHFNYLGVDQVIFVGSPESPFALDDLAVTVPPPDAACTYVVSLRGRRHDFGTGTGAVSVTTKPGCVWSVVNTNAWVTILSSLDSTGSGIVSYAVAAEPAATARSGFISIAGQSFAVSQSVAPPADEVMLTFDDVLPGVIPDGYGGLHWDNFGALDASIMRESSGYRIGMISPDNIAFNRYGEPVSISSDTPFTLKSAYLTRALDVRSGFGEMQVRVQGSIGTTVTYDHIYTISNTAPARIDFNYAGVDRVMFVASPSTQFAMDNLTLKPAIPLDSDGDGILDRDDACPGTVPGAAVNEHGCSIEQLVPCAGPARGGVWKNHGQYVATVAKVALSFRRAKWITAREMAAIVRAAAKSNCGKKPRTAGRHGA